MPNRRIHPCLGQVRTSCPLPEPFKEREEPASIVLTEHACWRYGPQPRRRRYRDLLRSGLGERSVPESTLCLLTMTIRVTESSDGPPSPGSSAPNRTDETRPRFQVGHEPYHRDENHATGDGETTVGNVGHRQGYVNGALEPQPALRQVN
jgi:hypothetical protein